MNWKSKIMWTNIVTFSIALTGLLTQTFPTQSLYLILAGQVLTIILRQLQGKEFTLGGKTIKL